MNPLNTRGAFLAIATGLASLAANFAVAAPVVDPAPTVVVSYRDLDLARPEDARRLYGRIRLAAETVCGDVPDRNFADAHAYHNCVIHAVTNAVSSVNATRLTEIHMAARGT